MDMNLSSRYNLNTRVNDTHVNGMSVYRPSLFGSRSPIPDAMGSTLLGNWTPQPYPSPRTNVDFITPVLPSFQTISNRMVHLLPQSSPLIKWTTTSQPMEQPHDQTMTMAAPDHYPTGTASSSSSVEDIQDVPLYIPGNMGRRNEKQCATSNCWNFVVKHGRCEEHINAVRLCSLEGCEKLVIHRKQRGEMKGADFLL